MADRLPVELLSARLGYADGAMTRGIREAKRLLGTPAVAWADSLDLESMPRCHSSTHDPDMVNQPATISVDRDQR
jgi:hypothetical protein